MPKSPTARTEKHIRQRLVRFVQNAVKASAEFENVISSLRSLGDVVIFGGVVRDIALFGVSRFRSDIDLVVDIDDRRALDIVLQRYDRQVTGFGGYRLLIEQRQIDVWPFTRTWAFQNGYVQGQTIRDLVNTTFFNWDAALFSLDTERLTFRPGYIDDLNRRYLDVVLAANPNPDGMVSRAVRLMRRTCATLSPDLVRFLTSTAGSSTSSRISELLVAESHLFHELKQHALNHPAEPFCLAGQLSLLDNEHTQHRLGVTA